MVSPLNHGLHRLKLQIIPNEISQRRYPSGSRRILFRKIAAFGTIFIFTFYILHFNCYAQSSKYIRVAIIQDTVSLGLKIKGDYQVLDSLNNEVLYRGKDLNTTVNADGDKILLGNIKSRTNKLFIKSDGSSTILINGRMYRGQIQLIKKEDAHLLVVNHINLEDYIKGILYHEASHYWPEEALKAQAIAVRTYALYQTQENITKDYDVTADVYSQVYGGRISERYRTNRAVTQTQGYILTYKGSIFPAYYHATCAGNTEDASLLWNIDITPLKGVSCGFCKDSVHFRWHYILSKDELKDALTRAGYKIITDIKDIAILGIDKSGRITTLRVSTAQENIDIAAKDFRNIIGPNIIRSTNFKVNPVRDKTPQVSDGYLRPVRNKTQTASAISNGIRQPVSNGVNLINQDIVFEGFGWGHGVGMCQWGAYFMAKQGYKYDKILKFYYPQSEIAVYTK